MTAVVLGMKYFSGDTTNSAGSQGNKPIPTPTKPNLETQIKSFLISHVDDSSSEPLVSAKSHPESRSNMPDHDLATSIKKLIEHHVDEATDEKTAYNKRLRARLDDAELDNEAHRALNQKLSSDKRWAEYKLSQLTKEQD